MGGSEPRPNVTRHPQDLSYGSLQAVHGNDLKSWSEENQSRNLGLEYQLRFEYFIVMQKNEQLAFYCFSVSLQSLSEMRSAVFTDFPMRSLERSR